METKLSVLRKLMDAGDWRGALKMAATFPRLGDEKAAITRGWEAFARPEFCRQLRKDPDALIADGMAALMRRYPLE